MFKKPSMARHEGVCFYNPHRGCPVCGENNTDVLENAKFLVVNNFEALSKKVNGCPRLYCLRDYLFERRKIRL